MSQNHIQDYDVTHNASWDDQKVETVIIWRKGHYLQCIMNKAHNVVELLSNYGTL